MVIHQLALERIAGSALNRISVSASPSRDKISDATVFMTFVVVYVSGEDHDAEASVSLPFLEHLRQRLLRAAGRRPAPERFRVRGAAVGGLREHQKHKGA